MIQLIEYMISNLKLDDDEHDDESSSAPSSVSNKVPPIRRLYVGNISGWTFYRHLRRLFRDYGEVVDVYITRRKYAFVTFRYPEDASSVLKLKRGELRLHFRTLYVAPADSWHQPVELPDGRVLWKSNSRDRKHDQCQEIYTISSGSESTSDDEKESEAVGGCDLPSQMSACDTVEQQQEGETKSGKVKRKKVKGECKIHILNDDCLMHIFSYLTKRERFRIERVCKRWKAVCLDMWLYQKHLDFTSVFPSSSESSPFPSSYESLLFSSSYESLPFSSSSESYLDMPILEAFLKRCGRNLQSLHLAHRPHRLNISVHKIIATYCKNLRCLHLGGLPVTTFGFRFLLTISQELRVLNLDCCLGVFDKDLRRMFRGCQHLESVTLSRNKNVTGKCLRFLAHAPLKELVLYECNSIHPGNLVSVLRELKSLTSLNLSSCDRVSLRDVPVIIGAVPKLQSLSLTESFTFNSMVVEALGQLHDLISLDLQQNYAVNDQIMDAITRSCLKIEKLNITGCNERIRNTGYVTDSGLRSLAALPNLFDLSMSYFPNLSDKALAAVASKGKLRKLVCRDCRTFTDVACISVVTSCNELELFDFSGCDHVTDATYRVALDSVKLRTNSVKLTLVVGGTRVSKYSAVKKNPLLEVDFSDLRTYRCRPRFVFDHCSPPPHNEDFHYMDSPCDWDDDDAESYHYDSDSYLNDFAHKE